MEAQNKSETDSSSKLETGIAIQDVPPLAAGDPEASAGTRTRKGIQFWLIILSVLLCLFLSALDFVSVVVLA